MRRTSIHKDRDVYKRQHQGRAAEKVLFPTFLCKGKYAISNMFFDTTRAHVEIAGARAIDCVVPEAGDTALRVPFKLSLIHIYMLSASGTIKFNADGNREALDIAIISVKDNAFYYTGNSVDMTGAMD